MRELYGEVCLGVYIEYDDDGSKDALWYGNGTAIIREWYGNGTGTEATWYLTVNN